MTAATRARTPLTLTNVKVESLSRSSDISLGWHYNGDRYHVWLSRDTMHVQQGIGRVQSTLYKNSMVKRGQPGHYDTRLLNSTTSENQRMVDQAMAMAIAGNMFVLSDQAIDEQARKEREEHLAHLARRRAEMAASAMLEVLKAIGTFWREGAAFPGATPTHPLYPGALLLASDSEAIWQAVERVVKLAEEGQ